ncbi:hypothetical protein RCH22_001144 [Cryobacterium psychrotolerans]|nr:hypothetical protein [Cryobacterium psychrotolerans]
MPTPPSTVSIPEVDDVTSLHSESERLSPA